MSTERDELAKVIYTSHRGNTQVDLLDNRRLQGSQLAWARFAADTLIASGWRKPRQVTTVEELDALPPWSVVRSEQATIWEKFKGNSGDFWAETMTLGKHPSSHIALPATVLYEGSL